MTVSHENKVTAANVASRKIRQTAKANFTRTECVAEVVAATGAEFTSKLQIVFPRQIGGIVGKLQRLVGSRVERPRLVAAQSMLGEPADADLRHPEVNRINDASIQTIRSGGIRIVVCLNHRLPETVVPNAELIGQMRSRRPNPSTTDYLSARIGLGQEQRIQHGGVFFGLHTVTNQICADK